MSVRSVPSLTAFAIAAFTLLASAGFAQTDSESEPAVPPGAIGGLSDLSETPPPAENDVDSDVSPNGEDALDEPAAGGIGGLIDRQSDASSDGVDPEVVPQEATEDALQKATEDASDTPAPGSLGEVSDSPEASPPTEVDDDASAQSATPSAPSVSDPGGIGGLSDLPQADLPSPVEEPTETAPIEQPTVTAPGNELAPTSDLPQTFSQPVGEIDESPIDETLVDDRINQTLRDAGAVLPEEIDAAYGAFQRGYFLTALAIAIEEAKKGDVAAQTLLGELLSRGLGIKGDIEEAAGWYQLAAEAGDDEAQYALALMHLDGRGVEKDTQKAADYFKQAGENGNMVALRELAFLHLKGEGIESRPMLAAAYLRRAAGANDGDAQFALGGLYTEGVGVAQSDVEAARWYGEAAKNGHIPGQIEYAIMLFNGRGVSKDEARAAGWFRQAARAGNPVAQVRFARLLVEGRGVEKNEREAARWYLIATRSGIKNDFMENWLLSLDADVRQAVEEELNLEAWPSSPAPEPGENPTPANSSDENDETASGDGAAQSDENLVPTTTITPSIGGVEQMLNPLGAETGPVTGPSAEESRPKLPSPVDILEE